MTNNLKLIQDDELFCFGHDAVELANFVEGTVTDYAADLCSGNGIIAVLLSGKKGIRTTAVEIDAKLAALARRNVELNNLCGMTDVINLPIQRISEVLERGSRSIVVCNPPYFKKGSGFSAKGVAAGARVELYVTLDEVLACAEYLLPHKGRLYMVYSVSRLAELMRLCGNTGLEPKELVIFGVKKPRLCLIKCVKGAAAGVRVECREVRDY